MIIKAIKNRCSVRSYKPEKIREEELQEILEAARMAPSGSNIRKTRIFVIQKEETLKEIAKVVALATKAGHADGISKERAAAIDPETHNFFYHAPTLLIMTSPEDSYNAYVDAACVIENAMLQATELNIGTCWVNNVRRTQKDEGVRAFLRNIGVRDDEIVIGCVAVGYPAGEMKPKEQTEGHEVIRV